MPASVKTRTSVATVLLVVLLAIAYLSSRGAVTAGGPSAMPEAEAEALAPRGETIEELAAPGNRDPVRAATLPEGEPEAPSAEQQRLGLGWIEGRVVSIDRTLLPPFRVTLMPVDDEGESEEGHTQSTLTDDSGAFDFGSRPAGTWLLVVRELHRPTVVADSSSLTPDWVENMVLLEGPAGTGFLTRRELGLVSGEHAQVELTVGRESSESGHVWGYLLGELLEELTYTVVLMCVDEAGEPLELRRPPDASGTFDFGFVPAGQANIVLMAAGSGVAGISIQGQAALLVVAGAEHELPLEMIVFCETTLEILDSGSGERLADAVVRVGDPEAGTSSTHRKLKSTPLQLTQGSYLLVATAPGYRVGVQEFRIAAYERETTVGVYLDPAPSITSVLVDVNGDPLAEVSLSITEMAGLSLASGMQLITRTDGSGRFDSGFVEPGDYGVALVRLVDDKHELLLGVVTLTGQPGPVLFESGE